MLQIWKVKSFRWYWLGLLLSGLGDHFGWMGLMWCIGAETESSAAMGSVILLYFLPGVFSSLIAGVLLDRYDRRKLIIADNLLRGCIIAVLVILLAGGEPPMGLIYLLLAVAGMLAPLSLAGAQALLPQLIADKQLLIKANGLVQSQWQLTYLFGPGLAGLAVAWYGEMVVLTADAFSFFLCALCFVRIKTLSITNDRGDDRLAASSREAAPLFPSLLRDLRAGYRYMFAQRPLFWLLVLSLFFNMSYGLMELLQVYVQEVLNRDAAELGLLWSALACGSLVGSLLFSFFTLRFALGVMLSTIIVLWGITTLPLALWPSLPVALLSMVLAGLSFAPYGILYTSYLQREVPQEMLGRVFTANRTITGVGMPLGAYLSGFLIPVIGMQQLLGAASLACVLVGLIAYRLLRHLR
ncbi:MFS transporter [Brevibacillus humidisoli]|uniref:MFS transporter n=1 Tax=Brevibacillus humidisoli TaxID=2895522 RepID=UPI001E636A45|nr:MFS transporter [Brevibacillus humidisoli]UFJ41588.1 MFS transporter [Brevibacillus humidisoli]